MRRLLPAVLILAALAPRLSAQDMKKSPHPATARPKLPAVQRSAPLIPLTQREKVVQLLNRLTFGPRPGDVEKVLAQTPERWFEQQLNPASINDAAVDRRLADYPTLSMSPDQALLTFPDGPTLQSVGDGRRPYPSDPGLAAVYEVLISKLYRDSDLKKLGPDGKLILHQPTEAELAAQKKTDQATAARIARDLYALPKNQRMAALIKLPVPERIAFTSYLTGDLRAPILNDFTPRERELFRGMNADIGAGFLTIHELTEAKFVRAILSERQLQEVMTDFWFNHFNVYIGKDSAVWYTTSYERDAIRKHALGKFRDLLLATATSPVMMVYLDNWQSIGPNSIANGVNPANPKSSKGNRGLNENYGREIMELHTLGVNGGYTQADVTALSTILTGWTVERSNQGGTFQFDPKRHEPGPKQWLGHTIGTDTVAAPSAPDGNRPPGMNEGVQALTLLAANPKTAHFISYKLAQRFVADEPPPALVDRMAATYLSTDGDIKAILRTLVRSPEFNSRKYFRNKVKTPMEFLASAFRTTATDPVSPDALGNTIRTMGMPLYFALPPTGYYITADRWMNASGLIDRLNFAYALTTNKFGNQKFDSTRVLALGLPAQPAASPSQNASSTTRPKYAEALLTTGGANVPLPTDSAGSDTALRVLESTLIGGEVSPQTNQLIHKQIGQLTTPATPPTETLNLLTALVMGSPEFQLR
jgi:uncharacterized protein (DUF1800 family)